MDIIKKLIDWLEFKTSLISNERFTKYLRKKGMRIGENVIFTNRSTLDIDLHKPTLVEIGDNVFINRGFSLLTHDYVSHVFLNVYSDYVSSTGKVTIGNNVVFGRNVSILKGVSIGDNVFIGFGSVVTKDIPSNCVSVGVPAKVICSLDEYYSKRKSKYVEEAFEYAQSIREVYKREPVITEFLKNFQSLLVEKKVMNI
jgi:acetyltransferase-like isoleucine patch superfamily enzyme